MTDRTHDHGPGLEQWRSVPGYEGFDEVSSIGRVRSVDRTIQSAGPIREKRLRGRVLRQKTTYDGYKMVVLSVDGVHWSPSVHKLILEAFVGQRPDGFEACHGDGDPGNNALANLRWDTSSANKADMVAHERHPNARKTHCKNGHPFAGANLMVSSTNTKWRGCRTCHLARCKARRDSA